uniref:Uncharacterized protein n=1 Tax=Arundo donax TaxID=35708 RepID=A0A0A9DPF9_ARUDO
MNSCLHDHLAHSCNHGSSRGATCCYDFLILPIRLEAQIPELKLYQEKRLSFLEYLPEGILCIVCEKSGLKRLLKFDANDLGDADCLCAS